MRLSSSEVVRKLESLERMEAEIIREKKDVCGRWGRLVRRRRQEKRLTLQDMARRVGCSHVYLSRCERGDKQWSSSMLRKVIKELNKP